MKYPDFVRVNRPKGTVVKRVGNTYHVYYATTKRVPEKSYPVQVIKGYAGTIDENGFHPSKRVSVYEGEVIVRECGFTNYLLSFEEIFVNDYNRHISKGKDEKRILFHSLICILSSNSYLHEETGKILNSKELAEEYAVGIPNQITAIEKMIGRKMDDLQPLKEICNVRMGGRLFGSELTKTQKSLLEELGIDGDDIR